MKKIKIVSYKELDELREKNEIDYNIYEYAIVEDGCIMISENIMPPPTPKGTYPEYVKSVEDAKRLYDEGKILDGMLVITENNIPIYFQ